MFISTLSLFKIGIGPSSSHTFGPVIAANMFRDKIQEYFSRVQPGSNYSLHCILKGSLALTGKGHATDKAVALGIHDYLPENLASVDVDKIIDKVWNAGEISIDQKKIKFIPEQDITFDLSGPLPEHPNGMIFELKNRLGDVVLSETYFSIGGGFINTLEEIDKLKAPLQHENRKRCQHAFDCSNTMLQMARNKGLSIAEMKRENELAYCSESELDKGLNSIWEAMQTSVEKGLRTSGVLPGTIKINRRAKLLHDKLVKSQQEPTLNEWLCAYAMAVSEENAAGHMIVTAPTNGSAGVIPAILYYLRKYQNLSTKQIHDFLLTASAIGGIIKFKSSISGAEVGCQGEVGSASSMAAGALCAIMGGDIHQVEKAAEIALEHHLGLTCDPVAGLVQVPCIERNGFGAVKAFTAASIALRENGKHFITLDSCINAMKQIGYEMSEKYKETSLGGLAVNYTEC